MAEISSNNIESDFLKSRIILTLTNKTAKAFSFKVLKRLGNKLKTYFSSDSADFIFRYPAEVLNDYELGSLLYYDLTLKKNAIVILLRNI